MRKNFLLLFLMALLPLAGWAQGAPSTFTNLAKFKVVVDPEAAKYGSGAPTVKIVNTDDEAIYYTAGFTATWSPALGTQPGVRAEGYTVTVTADNTNTYGVMAAGNNTAQYFVMKATDNAITTAPVAATGLSYDGDAKDLITNYTGSGKAAAKYGTILYSVNGGAYSSAKPTATNPGTYTVKYKVEGTDDYNAVAEATLADVTITGQTINAANYAAPEGISGLNFIWENGAAKAQALITAGSVYNENAGGPFGTMKYRFKKSTASKWSAYSTSIPTATDAATYNIQWMIEAETGYYNIEDQDIANVTIAAIEPATVTSATGKTGLVYAGDAVPTQALLEATGSASDGASVKYSYQKSTDGGSTWTDVATDLTNIADVTGTVAGIYKITTYVKAGGNYTYKAADPIQVTIAKANAFTSAPTAANLTWTAQPQQLIVAGAGTVNGKVKYQVGTSAWTDDITTVTGTDGGAYTVKYKVEDANYVAVAETTIPNTKIKYKPITVKVNDATKVYDNTTALTTATVDGGGDAFTFITPIEGKADFSALTAANYVAVEAKNADEYDGALTVAVSALEAINTNKTYFYDYTVVPGKLTISPCPIYVEANASLTAKYGETYNIAKEYTIKGGEAGDVDASNATSTVMSKYFTTAPVLTAVGAAAVNPEVAAYDLAFTAGTTASNYTMDLTKGENEDGYFINGNKFTVTPDPDKKIVITVLPHTQKYTGVAESWDNLVEGTDYVVTGLMTGDALTTAPTFTRSEADKFDVKYDGANVVGYTLSASGAAVADLTKYPGGIVYNNSTFTIEPAELTATVNQQTIFVGGDIDDIDQDAWTVDGLQNGEAKTILGGTLAINSTEGTTTEKADVNVVGLYTKGLKLTIAKGNYTLKDGTQWGALRVITLSTLELDPTDADLATKIADAAENCKGADGIAGTTDDNYYAVTFANKTLKANTWYTMVLPFNVKATELVNAVMDEDGESVFTIANRLSSTTTTGNIVFKLEMKEIPANEPFLIKTAEDVDLQNFWLLGRTIVNGIPMTPVYDGNLMYGTYEFQEIQCPAGSNVLKWLVNKETTKPADPTSKYTVNDWKVCRDYKAPINALEAYLYENRTVEANAAAPTIITVEDFDGQATTIKTLNTETMKAYAAEGWYTIDGIKLQGAPTEKGVYINNGKKVVIK